MAKVDVVCGWCGDEFSVHESRVRAGRGKYCSRGCYEKGKVVREPNLSGMYEINKDTGCWVWSKNPGSRYPKIRVDGRSVSAHVYMWSIASGATSADGVHVHHVCGNKRCVNPDHLVAMPASAHMRHHHAKLDEESVNDIRVSTERVVDLSRKHGVSPATICDIRSGRTWGDRM